ncbi:MAG: hypothetical protein H0W70_07165 [Actinobacteria bacterium]|nr:hypothetical protein [Actinomycetota bacterium]
MAQHRSNSRTRLVAVIVAVAVVASAAVIAGHRLGNGRVSTTLAVGTVPTVLLPPSTTTTLPPPTTTATTVAPTTSAAPRPKATAAPRPKPRPTGRLVRAAPILAGSIDAFRGMGAWVDVFDWSNEFTKNKPVVGVAAIDRMADLGVQTLYIQTAKQESANDVVDPGLLQPLIERAHQRNMAVVAWYLPTLEDPARDLTRLVASARLKVEGVGVDIESRKVSDHAERSRRLVELSAAAREQLPGRQIAAVIMPPVVTDVINPAFWPGFPWQQLKPLYDLWMPMDYWTFRKADSGYRDAYRYTAENIDLTRRNLGNPNAVVHAVGGIGDTTTPEDIDGYYRASAERGGIGGGLYDYRTTGDNLYPGLQRFRV